MSELQALQQAGHEVINDALQQVAIPRRFRTPMLEIWTGQARLAQRRGRRSLRHAEHPRFRAAYDFLLLRQHAGEPLQELCEWWTRLQEQDDEGRKAMCDALRSAPAKKRRRRKRKSATSPGTE